MREQRLQEVCIDAFDPAGMEVIHALDHADGTRHDHVGAGGAKVVRRQTLEDLVGEAVGRSQRQVGGQNLTFVGERSD